MPAFVGLWCVAALLGISAAAIVIGRWSWSFAPVYFASLVVCLAGLAAAFWHLWMGLPPETLSLGIGLPGTGARFRLDPLAAYFLIVANLGGAMASLYALGYGRHQTSQLRVLPFYPAYLAGMNLVLLADDAFSFLIAWEFMSLTSWALVLSNHRAQENIRAAYVYLLMASCGTLALLLAFGLLAGANGNYAFEAIRAGHPDALAGTLVFLFALAGAGSKAGLVPLHIWLPLAHPAAPSHVSALMSGVMTKIAVYGFIRIVFDLVGAPAWWWSLIVLGLGGVTAVIGILYALMQQDLKRLLAYSTVENVGIVFIGLGLALAFRASDMAVPAALAMTAALLHVFNHSLFKSLLFFGAGVVLTATGERNMEKLGGLIHRLPRTAVAFLIGCAAISALPPLNGFVSEWLTFQAILVGPGLPQWGLRFMIPAVGALLALSAALAAACFVKAYGIVFLGRARSAAAEKAREADGFSARRDVHPRRTVLCRGHPAGRDHRLARPGGAGRRGRAVAGADLPALGFDRADCLEPQLLQRAADPAFPDALGGADGAGGASLCHAGDAPERHLGLRLSRSGPGHAILGLELRHADPAGVRHDRVPGA